MLSMSLAFIEVVDIVIGPGLRLCKPNAYCVRMSWSLQVRKYQSPTIPVTANVDKRGLETRDV